MVTREELLIIVKINPEALVDLVLRLQEEIVTLNRRKSDLEARLNKNSSNSNKPPSSDGLSKPIVKSLRKKTGKKPGGQVGHEGKTLERVDNPDQIVTLTPKICPCGASGCFHDQPVIDVEYRQVFELPEPKLEVTEYRGEIKCCPRCGRTVRTEFPEGVNAPVQYGLNFRSFLVYLYNQQLLPSNRISQLCQDLFGYSVSEATLYGTNKTCYNQLESFEMNIISRLQNEPIISVDESGLRVAGKLYWLHTVSTDRLTFYGVHPKRGNEATDFFNILPHFKGVMVHDCWKPYLKYPCGHSLCNAHSLREFKFLFEEKNQEWADKMSHLLLEMNEFVQEQKEKTDKLTEEQKEPWIERYHQIVAEGKKTNPQVNTPEKKPKRGRVKKSKAQNMLDRLEKFESYILAFFHDFKVPFTNNRAEQDLRMIKVKQNISGGFRTFDGSRYFARTRSYISSARKNSFDILKATRYALRGQPILFE